MNHKSDLENKAFLEVLDFSFRVDRNLVRWIDCYLLSHPFKDGELWFNPLNLYRGGLKRWLVLLISSQAVQGWNFSQLYSVPFFFHLSTTCRWFIFAQDTFLKQNNNWTDPIMRNQIYALSPSLQASFGGLSPGLMFILRTIGLNSRHDVYKEAVLQTLAALRKERKSSVKEE